MDNLHRLPKRCCEHCQYIGAFYRCEKAGTYVPANGLCMYFKESVSRVMPEPPQEKPKKRLWGLLVLFLLVSGCALNSYIAQPYEENNAAY